MESGSRMNWLGLGTEENKTKKKEKHRTSVLLEVEYLSYRNWPRDLIVFSIEERSSSSRYLHGFGPRSYRFLNWSSKEIFL